jgi:ketosteroid isomerase-like protein
MPARKPEDLGRLFTDALNAGDLDALMQLYEPGAMLRPGPDQIAAGSDAMRAALAGFLGMKPRFKLAAKTLGEVGDLALTSSKWELSGTGPDGAPVTMNGQGVEVARRQADGTWRWVIDTPWGLGWDA